MGGAAVTVDAVPALVAEYPALAIESAERAEEHALLHLLNLQAESGGWLLLTAATPPAYWPIRLPDLASRLRAMPLCRIAPPDDRLLAAVVAKRFADRGIEVSAAIAPLIVTRIERSFAAADRMVAEIDRAALAAGRAVTAAFVREILERDFDPLLIALPPAYLPSLGDLAEVGLAWATALGLGLAGRFVPGARATPGMALVAGWGAFALAMTVWGALGLGSLAWAVAAFCAGTILLAWHHALRPGAGAVLGAAAATIFRLGAVSLPLWLVLAPIRPSQLDTFLNLMPNAFYLVDHGGLPGDGRPPAYSFIAGAPYNTQFATYPAALIDPGFPAAGMSFFNLSLQLAAALLFASLLEGRARAEAKPLGWRALAGGFLLAIPLNPGFVPRISLSAYGEPALAATALFAACAMLRAHRDMAAGRPPGSAAALGLALAAMVNTKQSGIGLVLALALAFLALRLRRGGFRALPPPGFLAWGFLPSLGLYALWRVYVLTHFASGGELKPLPISLWQWTALPRIFGNMAASALEKPFWFVPALALAALGLAALARRGARGEAGEAAAFFALLLGAYNAFLVLTYIAEFPGEMGAGAHSYFRYSTHLSLVMILGWIRVVGSSPGLVEGMRRHARGLGAIALLAGLMAPLAFAERLRFDLDPPQPSIWDLAKQLAPHLRDDTRLALLLPGDNGSVAAVLEGILRETPPRRRFLDLWVRNQATPAALEAAAAAGYDLAFVSCSRDLGAAGAGRPALPPGEAALLRHDAAGWTPVDAWPYPSPGRRRWQHMVAWAPLCRDETPGSR